MGESSNTFLLEVEYPMTSTAEGTSEKLQERLLRLFLEFAYDKEKYRRRVDKHLKSSGRNIWQPKSGHLKLMEMISLLQEDGGGFHVELDYLSGLVPRLTQWGVVSDLGRLEPNGSNLSLDDRRIRLFNSLGILENCVWGTQFILSKYARATPAIQIEKNGSPHIGTGSIVRFGSPKNHKFFLVTNRHVIDPQEGIAVKKVEIDNTDLCPLTGDWKICATDDLAAIEIASWKGPYFCIDYEVRVLAKVTTLGYPKIPFSDDAYLAFHSGEINTVFRTTAKEELFLISNQIAPGSSGGPVMSEKGLLTGVAAKAFQGRYEPEADFVINWNAAVTFKGLRSFLKSISDLDDWTAATD